MFKKLQGNNLVEEQQQAWADILSSYPEEKIKKIKCLEDLFPISNAVWPAVASKGQDDYKVCSLLPISEKQIQVNYANLNRYFNLNKNNRSYPAIVNLTYLESIFAYSRNSKGNLFYSRNCSNTLQELITQKHLVSYACRNIGLFCEQVSNDPLSIAKALEIAEDSQQAAHKTEEGIVSPRPRV